MRRRKRNTKIEIGESSREVNKRGIRRRRVEQSRKPRERSKKKEQNSMVSGAGAQREGIEVKKRKKRRWTLRAVSTASAPVFIGRTFSYPKYSTQERKTFGQKRGGEVAEQDGGGRRKNVLVIYSANLGYSVL